MATIQNNKANLSNAYVRAIAAKAGVNISRPEDDYGIDLTLKEVITMPKPDGTTRYVESGAALDIQLKCSHDVELKENEIIYDLETKNYNDLISTDVNTPRILVLLQVPSEETEWILQDASKLEIRHCAYWISLRGKEMVKNKETKRIKIPNSQKFTSEALKSFFQKIKEGVTL